ncbi:MAG: hypothetical protein LBE37_16545 [Sphingobacterium sp.]|nr:hypothetical protein [Sphingobacterium sp.]
MQKQRAIALFFDTIENTPNAHVNVAIEYQGDVYLQNQEIGYVEEQKNYDSKTSFSFNSHQITNTLVYFLHIWLWNNKSVLIKFGFYSTNSITKEKTTERVSRLEITLPKEPILALIITKSYEDTLLDSVRKYLIHEYTEQYDTDISKELDDASLIAFLDSTNWSFEQDNEKDYKDEVLLKIEKSTYFKHLENKYHVELVYAGLLVKLEEKQDERDVLLKFLNNDIVENVFLKVASGKDTTTHIRKYIEELKFPRPENYISRHFTYTDTNDYWAQFSGVNTLLNVVQKDFLEASSTVRILIRATAGQGKSKELENIAYELHELKQNILPLRINVKNYSQDLNSLIASTYPYWPEILISYKVILLVDGLDEINPSAYESFIADFHHLLESQPKLGVIATIRTNFDTKAYTGNSFTTFKELFLHPLYKDDIDKYIDCYSNSKDAVNKIVCQPWCQSIAYIPFYLVELVDLFNDTTNTPPNDLKSFYAQIIQKRIEYDYYRSKERLDKEESYRVLQLIAVYMTLQGLNSIKYSDIKNLSPYKKSDYKSFSFFSSQEVGLETHFSFTHNNFQEYLCAGWLSELSWSEISTVVFNSETGFINTKLLNTTVILFSLLDKNSDMYQSLFQQIERNDYTDLFYLEKERLPILERLKYFRRFIQEGKQKKITYLAGDFNGFELVRFIDFDNEGFDFVVDELEVCEGNTNHCDCLLYLISEFNLDKLSRPRKQRINKLVNSLIVTLGYSDEEFSQLIKIACELLPCNEAFLNSVLKKCPAINTRYVLTDVINLIEKNNIPNQFEYVIDGAGNLEKNGNSLMNNHARIFSGYVVKNINQGNYQYLLNGLFGENDNSLIRILNETEYFESKSTKYINRIYITLAEIANATEQKEITESFINFLNKIEYNSYRDRYGSPEVFFEALVPKLTLNELFISPILLECRFVVNKLFNLIECDHSGVIINLRESHQIDDSRLKEIYRMIASNESETAINLSHYMAKEYPDEFRAISPFSDHKKQLEQWEYNGYESLTDRQHFIAKVSEVIKYIYDKDSDIIDENRKLQFHHSYWNEYCTMFNNSLVINFIVQKAYRHPIDQIVGILHEDKNWFSFIGKQLEKLVYNSDQTIPNKLKYSLQVYVNSILVELDFAECYEVDVHRKDIRVQVASWFIMGFIDLDLPVAIQLLCNDSIESYINGQKRLYEFLIEKFSLDTIKPYLIEIIHDQALPIQNMVRAIGICIDYDIDDVKEEIFEILTTNNSYLRGICTTYLIRFQFDKSKISRYFVNNKKITEDWQLDILKYVLTDEDCHSMLLPIIEEQVDFVPIQFQINHKPWNLCRYGLKLGGYNSMLCIFKYLQESNYYTLRDDEFTKVELLFPDELLQLSIQTLEVHKQGISDHAGSSTCGVLDSIITSIASSDINKYRQVLEFYDHLILKYIADFPNLKSLEWWKIRLTKKFQEKNSHYFTQKEVLEVLKTSL